MAEGHGQRRFRVEPPVGHDADEVLRWERVEDRDGERERVVVLGELGLEQEELVVQYVLLVDVLDEHVEWLGRAVYLRLELEVGSDGQFDAEHLRRNNTM